LIIKISFFGKINDETVDLRCSNGSFSDETVKYFSRVSCKSGQSTKIYLTVSGSPQVSQVGWSSPDIR